MTTLEVPGQQQVADVSPARSPWLIALRSLLRRKIAMAAVVYILFFYTVALLAPLLAPYSYTAQDLRNSYASPSRQHPFGTDVNGRDVLSRVIWATQTTMIVTIAASITGGFVIPVVLGLLAGYRRGWVDSLINRVGEAVSGLPPLLLLFLLVGTFRPRFDEFIARFYPVPAIGHALQAGGADLALVFLVFSIVSWVGGERLVRAQVLAVRQSEYVQAARGMGASTWRILRRHVYPNISWLVVISITSSLGGIALGEIGLTFLGLGVRPPTPSLGAMIYEASGPRQVAAHPNLLLIPGIIAVLLFLSFNLLGDALNDVLNPRTR
ncbi:MAG TPA: ABC transporter permease [Dehalococcoidia bacterium]|nr:ABC transporter permease [Dehalococcoidia bacterium]